MNKSDSIRAVVARYFNVSEAEVTDDFKFPAARFSSSIGRSTLHAAIKRLAGVDLPSVWTAQSFGELTKGVSKVPEPTLSVHQNLVPTDNLQNKSDLAIGLDLEDVDNLPKTDDVWSEPFYVENFLPEEIAYAVRQPDPRLTLCGLWSAKESIIKLGGVFADLRPDQIQIHHNGYGRPFVIINGHSRQGEIDISISHSSHAANAVCIARIVGPMSRSALEIPATFGSVPAPAKIPPFSVSRLPIYLAVFALFVSFYALVRSR